MPRTTSSTISAQSLTSTVCRSTALLRGDRIVVMKDGFIQQVDTPQNLYDLPVNEFVAGFMGSPQMNFIDATVVKEGANYALTFGATKIQICKSINAVVEGIGILQQLKMGALIVFERQTKLGEIIETGTQINCEPTSGQRPQPEPCTARRRKRPPTPNLHLLRYGRFPYS